MNPLLTLDAAVVPATARGLRRVLDTTRHGPGRAARWLDGRLAGRGPLGLVRETPQVGLVAVGLLLAAGAFGAVRVGGQAGGGTAGAAASAVPVAVPGCPSGTAAPGGAAYVGPPGNGPLAGYLDAQNRLLDACAAAAPDARAMAVVSLPQPVTPSDVAGALRGVTVATAYVVLPGRGSTPYALPLHGARGGTVAVAAAVSAAYAAAQVLFEQDRTVEQSRARQAQADADELAVGQLRDRCACVYGALVIGTVRQLAALRTSSVRLVALAPAGTAAAKVTARPLLPAETTAPSQAAVPTPVVAGEL